MMDEQIMIVSAQMPDEFERKVNALLKDEVWRIAETEMSVTDHHYYALLIKRRPTVKRRGGANAKIEG